MSATADQNERLLRASRLFSRFDPSLVAELARRAVRHTLTRNELLWHAGDPAIYFTVIVNGLMKVVRRAADGTEAIVGIFGPRESIGDTAALELGRYPADALAASDTAEVLRVDAGPVLAAMAVKPEIGEAITRALLEHTRALQQKIEIMSAGSVPKRLATLLLYLAEKFGDEMGDGSTLVPVALSRSELARLVSATVETTIRTVSRWQKAHWLETNADGFVIRDLDRLREITTGEG